MSYTRIMMKLRKQIRPLVITVDGRDVKLYPPIRRLLINGRPVLIDSTGDMIPDPGAAWVIRHRLRR